MNIKKILSHEPVLAKQAEKLLHNPDTSFPVLSAKIKLTWNCNLRCRYCSLWRLSQTPRTADVLDLETVCSILIDLHRQGLRKVHFSGGEVLLVPYFESLVKFSRNLNLQVNLTTNGTLITKTVARYLVNSRVHTVNISLDSHLKKIHDRMRGVAGAWEKSWEGIHHLQLRKEKKGRGPIIAVNTLATRHNIDSMQELYQLLMAGNIDRWQILPVDTENKKDRPTRDQWKKLAENWPAWKDLLSRPPIEWSSLENLKKAEKGKYSGKFYHDRSCYAPWFNMFIDADGSVYPCCMGKHNFRPLGNIRQQNLQAILEGDARREIQCAMAAGAMYPVCERCDDFLEENRCFEELKDS